MLAWTWVRSPITEWVHVGPHGAPIRPHFWGVVGPGACLDGFGGLFSCTNQDSRLKRFQKSRYYHIFVSDQAILVYILPSILVPFLLGVGPGGCLGDALGPPWEHHCLQTSKNLKGIFFLT